MAKNNVNREAALASLIAPYETEKSSRVNDEQNQYVFKVRPYATKKMVAQAVEELFDVKVTKVTSARIKGKVKRNRHGLSRQKTIKKVYVTVADNKTIDFLR